MESNCPYVDIFYRTYEKDVEWLAYSLRSVQKFAKGFRKIVIAIPHDDYHKVSHLTHEQIHLIPSDKGRNGYLSQQLTKLHAEEYCGGDVIVHMDSDTIFTKEVTPDRLMPNGKPVILYEEMQLNPWSDVVEKCLGWKPKYEFMRRHPFVYPRWAYSEFRAWFKAQKGIEIDEYVMRQPANEFSEYNVLGAFLWETHRDCIDFIKPSDFPVFTKQHWSWGGVDQHRKDLEKVLE